jgi:hypothetical protein
MLASNVRLSPDDERTAQTSAFSTFPQGTSEQAAVWAAYRSRRRMGSSRCRVFIRNRQRRTAHLTTMTVYCLSGGLPALRSLVLPTVLKRAAHPAGRRSLLAETKSFIVPFGCAFFHFEYKRWATIPPTHPPKIPRNVWCCVCPAIPPNIAPWIQPIALAGLGSVRKQIATAKAPTNVRRNFIAWADENLLICLFLLTRLDVRCRPHNGKSAT